jgi:alpha-tubulin suppressor-like RCC1 family protein
MRRARRARTAISQPDQPVRDRTGLTNLRFRHVPLVSWGLALALVAAVAVAAASGAADPWETAAAKVPYTVYRPTETLGLKLTRFAVQPCPGIPGADNFISATYGGGSGPDAPSLAFFDEAFVPCGNPGESATAGSIVVKGVRIRLNVPCSDDCDRRHTLLEGVTKGFVFFVEPPLTHLTRIEVFTRHLTASQIATVLESLAPVTKTREGATAISVGSSTVCVLTRSGGVKCWGYRLWSAPPGTPVRLAKPADVPGLETGIEAISVGGEGACAVTRTGDVLCFGFGEQGPGSTPSSGRLVSVHGLSTAASTTSVGFNHVCALLRDGSVECWGQNRLGDLGNGTTTDSRVPVRVKDLRAVVDLSAGDEHNCAVTRAGNVKCWGSNQWGQLGQSKTAVIESTVPLTVPDLPPVAAVASGHFGTCALTRTRQVLCWGNTVPSGERVQIALPAVSKLSGSSDQYCVVTTTGAARCWGQDQEGQLGDGQKRPRTVGLPPIYVPVQVKGLVVNVASVVPSLSSGCALHITGSVACWGLGPDGNLGNGSFGDSTSPVPVSGL